MLMMLRNLWQPEPQPRRGVLNFLNLASSCVRFRTNHSRTMLQVICRSSNVKVRKHYIVPSSELSWEWQLRLRSQVGCALAQSEYYFLRLRLPLLISLGAFAPGGLASSAATDGVCVGATKHSALAVDGFASAKHGKLKKPLHLPPSPCTCPWARRMWRNMDTSFAKANNVGR